ncbi:MAG: hypothetical protein IT384_27745 [Deltaproteobacteria bacterium]|nr:hypothetical protein [Deltaproteobacteria bacterium]
MSGLFAVGLLLASQAAPAAACAPIEGAAAPLVLAEAETEVEAEPEAEANADLDPEAETEADRRRRVLARLLEAESGRARLWTGIWGGTFGLLAVGQLGLTPFQPEEERPDSYAGAAASAIGVAQLVVMPLSVLADGDDLLAISERWAESAGPCAALEEVELRLIRGAASEALGVSWWAHAANVALNVALGAVLGVGLDHWVSAGLSVALGVAVGEAAILTQPARLPAVLEAYRTGGLERLDRLEEEAFER